ncbi:MAG: peptidoglycan DD-metalloendopeptidase family protein [Lachnospiraceae bacterium]|nr:peptidoglycan DD-metalloendopeptidase family protein [Lachnospiraceae bacterium]
MQNNFVRKQKKKEFVMVLLICMVCLSAVIWGAAAFSKRDSGKKKDNSEDIINLNETTNSANAATSGTDGEGESVNSKVNNPTQQTEPVTESVTEPEPQTTVPVETTERILQNTEPEQNETQPVQNETPDTKQANSTAVSLSFNQESILMWPVEGNVVLGFNMENTIYFPTLDSYRCNPAMIIQGELGMDVVSAAKGYVKEIGTDAEIGNYIVMSLGDDYEITYGQLADICVNKGDLVDQAQKIASVAEPSKYYVREGANIYLKLTQAGTPVDPLDYLE